MLPLSDGLPAHRFPVVTIALIAANVAVWIFYELPNLKGAVAQESLRASASGPKPSVPL